METPFSVENTINDFKVKIILTTIDLYKLE